MLVEKDCKCDEGLTYFQRMVRFWINLLKSQQLKAQKRLRYHLMITLTVILLLLPGGHFRRRRQLQRQQRPLLPGWPSLAVAFRQRRSTSARRATTTRMRPSSWRRLRGLLRLRGLRQVCWHWAEGKLRQRASALLLTIKFRLISFGIIAGIKIQQIELGVFYVRFFGIFSLTIVGNIRIISLM